MKKLFLIPALALAVAACSGQASLTPQERLAANDAQIDALIAQMSLEEKVEMLHSKTNMSSAGNERFGIADINYADGPFGIREEGVPNGFQSAGWVTDSATYFPTGSALAATFSKDLAYRYGHAMGTEGRLRGKDIILGPAINIQRLAVCGRSYEYLSEDPHLAAELATAYTKGSQDAGTAVCIKHFALNNQEANRGTVNSVCDERTMREIYLKPFEKAVVEGGAMAVMPAYNKVNGFYCTENEHLQNEILRGDWGFKGLTVSDWGATHSTMGAALHGLDVQMTGSNYLGQPLIDSVRAGKVPESVIDAKVRSILRVRFAIRPVPADEANKATASQPESRQTAYDVASKAVVLLKNDGILPIKKDVKKIAVIGLNATATTAAGGMGAGVKAPYEVTPLQGLMNKAPEGVEITYAPAYRTYYGMFAAWYGLMGDPSAAVTVDEAPQPELLAEAVAAAEAADLVIFFAGTNKTIESESFDRQDIKLPVSQDAIAQALAEVNPNIVTIIISGGPCDLQVVEPLSGALVQGWWNGMEGGNALADILFGNIAPSGRLPFTFPVKLEDSPAYALGCYPQKEIVQGDLFGNMFRQDVGGQMGFFMKRYEPDAIYAEKQYVGYRWYDTREVPVKYAFGHGLSYCCFEYTNLKTNRKTYRPDDVIKVTFNIRNLGKMDADEVPQLYVHRIDSQVEWAYKELKAFDRVTVAAGQTKKVTLTVPVSELRYWDESTNGWTLEDGNIEILVGGASDDIRLKTVVEI